MAQSQLDLAHFQGRLEEMRASMERELEQIEEETTNVNENEGYGVNNHPADDATDVFDRQRQIAVALELQRDLKQVRHALERIDQGSYGLCEVDEQPIPIERLEARPAATLCIQHQRERDDQARDVPDPQV